MKRRRANPSRETVVVVAAVTGLAAFAITAMVMQGRRNFAIDVCTRLGQLAGGT